MCYADVPSCLLGSDLQDSAGSSKSPANSHPSLWSALTVAACSSASQRSDRRHAVYRLPVQLLGHMHTLQQNIDVDTWQQLWGLYATGDVRPGESYVDAHAACVAD